MDFPLDVSVKVNPEESPSMVFTLAGLHDISFIGGGERGITLGNPCPINYSTEISSRVR